MRTPGGRSKYTTIQRTSGGFLINPENSFRKLFQQDLHRHGNTNEDFRNTNTDRVSSSEDQLNNNLQQQQPNAELLLNKQLTVPHVDLTDKKFFGMPPQHYNNLLDVPTTTEEQDDRDDIPTSNEDERFIPTNRNFMQGLDENGRFTPDTNENQRYIPTSNEGGNFIPATNENGGFVPTTSEGGNFIPTVNRDEGTFNRLLDRGSLLNPRTEHSIDNLITRLKHMIAKQEGGSYRDYRTPFHGYKGGIPSSQQLDYGTQAASSEPRRRESANYPNNNFEPDGSPILPEAVDNRMLVAKHMFGSPTLVQSIAMDEDYNKLQYNYHAKPSSSSILNNRRYNEPSTARMQGIHFNEPRGPGIPNNYRPLISSLVDEFHRMRPSGKPNMYMNDQSSNTQQLNYYRDETSRPDDRYESQPPKTDQYYYNTPSSHGIPKYNNGGEDGYYNSMGRGSSTNTFFNQMNQQEEKKQEGLLLSEDQFIHDRAHKELGNMMKGTMDEVGLPVNGNRALSAARHNQNKNMLQKAMQISDLSSIKSNVIFDGNAAQMAQKHFRSDGPTALDPYYSDGAGTGRAIVPIGQSSYVPDDEDGQISIYDSESNKRNNLKVSDSSQNFYDDSGQRLRKTYNDMIASQQKFRPTALFDMFAAHHGDRMVSVDAKNLARDPSEITSQPNDYRRKSDLLFYTWSAKNPNNKVIEIKPDSADGKSGYKIPFVPSAPSGRGVQSSARQEPMSSFDKKILGFRTMLKALRDDVANVNAERKNNIRLN